MWVHTNSSTKLDRCGVPAQWVGYDADSTHAHRIYWPETQKVSVERDIKFTEDAITVCVTPSRPSKTPAPQQRPSPTPPPVTVEDVPDEDDQPLFQHDDDGESEVEVEGEPQSRMPTPEARRTTPWPETQPTRQSAHIRKPSAKVRQIQTGEGTSDGGLGTFSSQQLMSIAEGKVEEHTYLATLTNAAAPDLPDPGGDPRSVKEAMARPDWPHWKEVMDRKYKSLKLTRTWRTIDCPPSCNVISCRWVFILKRKANGSVDKYKARLVAHGFTQVLGLDYTDTYTPVARLASFQTILALAACQNWNIDAFDLNSAYLNGELGGDEEIYMEEPLGYETSGEDSIKRLQKAIYRLKQAGWKWYDALTRVLTNIGFHVSSADPGVFVAHKGEHILILAAHVDDCIITGSSPELIQDFKQKLNDCYALTNLRPVNWLLGIKVTRDQEARTISLSQEGFISSILARFNLQDAKVVDTPMMPSAAYSKEDCPANDTECAHMARVPYREAIGSLMYASVATRPDITFAVSTLSQFLDNPGEAHWEAVTRGLRVIVQID